MNAVHSLENTKHISLFYDFFQVDLKIYICIYNELCRGSLLHLLISICCTLSVLSGFPMKRNLPYLAGLQGPGRSQFVVLESRDDPHYSASLIFSSETSWSISRHCIFDFLHLRIFTFSASYPAPDPKNHRVYSGIFSTESRVLLHTTPYRVRRSRIPQNKEFVYRQSSHVLPHSSLFFWVLALPPHSRLYSVNAALASNVSTASIRHVARNQSLTAAAFPPISLLPHHRINPRRLKENNLNPSCR